MALQRHRMKRPGAARTEKAFKTSRANANSIVGRDFRPNYTERRAIAGPRALNGSCDDEGVPLICPTCQVFAQSASVPATGCYLAWGRFRYFWLGATATWRRKRLDAYDGPLTPRTKLEDSAVPT